MQAKDIMTSPALTVPESATVLEAARLMLDRRVSGLPVVNEAGDLVGVVTEGDFLRRAELGAEASQSLWRALFIGGGRSAKEYALSHGRKVGDVMTRDVASVTPATPVADIVDLMLRRRVKRAPVVESGRLIGIVSRSDLLRKLAEKLSEESAVERGDEDIRRDILRDLGRQSWGGAQIRVEVRDGAVELTGAVFDDRERAAARIVAENTPGVRAVSDRLAWIEPYSGMLVQTADEREDAAPGKA